MGKSLQSHLKLGTRNRDRAGKISRNIVHHFKTLPSMCRLQTFYRVEQSVRPSSSKFYSVNSCSHWFHILKCMLSVWSITLGSFGTKADWFWRVQTPIVSVPWSPGVVLSLPPVTKLFFQPFVSQWIAILALPWYRVPKISRLLGYCVLMSCFQYYNFFSISIFYESRPNFQSSASFLWNSVSLQSCIRWCSLSEFTALWPQ